MEDYSEENLAFLNGNNIKFFHYRLQGNKVGLAGLHASASFAS